MAIVTYDFPNNPAATGYCIFPADIEDDPLVVFHATPLENETAIVEDGFKADPNGVSKLQSVSFAKRSLGALTHAMGRRGNAAVDWVIFAVRYPSFANVQREYDRNSRLQARSCAGGHRALCSASLLQS